MIVFALFQGERLNLSGSIGAQSLSYDIVRHIKYPSFNPNTESANSLANSHPEDGRYARARSAVGYAFGPQKFTFEPFFNLEYLDATVDAFAEERSINLLSDDSVSKRFDLSISQQSIESLDATLGLRFQYVLTPRFGVIVPYLTLEAHRELEDDARTITAGYAAIEDILGRDALSSCRPTLRTSRTRWRAPASRSCCAAGGNERPTGRSPAACRRSCSSKPSTVSCTTTTTSSTGGFRYEF